MDKATLNLMLLNLEGYSEDSISDNNSLAGDVDRLDNICEGNCYNQLQLVLQRAISIIKLKDRQCKEKDDLIKSLKKSIELQQTIDLLKTSSINQANSSTQSNTSDQNLASVENQIRMNVLNNTVTGCSTWMPFDQQKYSGVELIAIPGMKPFTVPLIGPGWLVMQRRFNGEVEFTLKTMDDFYNGFGDLKGEFWLGLAKVHKLTTNQRYELYIHLVDFDDQIRYACYDHFVIGSRDENYRIKSLGAYSGNAGDAMRALENCVFEKHYLGTVNDSYRYSFYWGAYDPVCQLNGIYFDTKENNSKGIWWDCWQEEKMTLKSVQMLIRPQLKY